MRIAVAVLVIQLFIWMLHHFIYRSVIKFFHITDPSHLLWIKILFFVLSVSFIIASLVSAYWYGPAARALYKAAAIWLGTGYWLVWVSVIAHVSYRVLGRILPERDFSYLLASLFVAALVVSAYGVWHSYRTVVTRVTVRIPNLPESWAGKRVALVADTHLGHVRNLDFSKKIAGLITEQKPEAVFIAGDFYDGPPADFKTLAQPFGMIPAPRGVFFAPGNHEEFRTKSDYTDALKAAGVTVLDNAKQDVDGLQVVGLGYLETVRVEDERRILQDLSLDKNRASILIKHVPSHIGVAAEFGLGLQLSGHTHMGQVFPLGYITRLVYDNFNYRLKRMGETQVYTTSGAGTWGPPQRVGTNSEIVVITLEKK